MAGAGSRWRLGLAVAAGIVALDQLTKWWVLALVLQPPRMIEVTSFFNLVMVWNRGISFGLADTGLDAMRWVLVALAAVITVALIVWLTRIARPFLAVVVGLVIGGAVGNLIDRVRFGAVFDFLDFHAFGYHWYAFNVADAAISVGVALLVIDSLFGRPADRTVLSQGANRD
jgi:signal peptidase II